MKRPVPPLLAAIVPLLSLAALASRAAGEEPAALLFTASDVPRLAAGFTPPRAGEYTVKVWSPARQIWSLAADGQALTLSAKVEGEDRRPSWRSVGRARLGVDAPATLRIAGAGAVPAVLGLSTDPDADFAGALDLIRGRVDAADPPADLRRTTVRTNQEGAAFRAPASAQAWRQRARAVRERILVALGLWPLPPRTPLNPQVFGKVSRDGYTIEKVVLETLPGFTLSGNLYRPIGASGRVPALLCPHGHWADGRVNPEVQARCIRWAKLGCVVFLYDMVGYNDSKPFGHAFLNDRLRRWGQSLAGLQTWDSLRALDWLTALPDVDPARIGCTGESGGGTQTFLLTAIDDRVRVAAPVVMVSDTFQGGCVCENAAGLRIGTDNVEFAALAAPRPLKLVGATGDWTKLTMTRAYPAIRDVYALLGEPDRVTAEVFDFPHNYNQTSRNAVYAFMAPWLLGLDDPARTKEGEQAPEPPADLLTFSSDHPAPAVRKTPERLEADLVRTLGAQLDQFAPARGPASWEAARGLLRTALTVRVGVDDPPPSELSVREVRRSARGGVAVTHLEVARKATGATVPVVVLAPAHPSGRLTVLLTESGKAGLVDPIGTPTSLVRALLDRGQVVVGLDPLLIGESVDPAAPTTRRPDTVHFETYNPALAADRAQDLATVLAWARARPNAREVGLIALGGAGPLALLARPVLGGLARTAIDLDGFDYGDGAGAVPAGLELPGVLQFGGLRAAAALTAPAPLWVFRAGPGFDRAWPETSYSLADAAPALRIDAGPVRAADLARWINAGERD